MGEVAEIKGGIQKGKARAAGTPTRSVPYLRVANVQRGYLKLDNVTELEVTDAEIEALKLEAGDVLMNEGGDPDKLGRGWVWQNELPICIHQNHVFRARLLPEILDSKFLSHFANGPGQAYFLEKSKQTTGIASISSKQLHSFPVHIPPLNEQRRIVARIEELTARSKSARESLQAIPPLLEKFRQSVLAAAFRGDLTAEWRRQNPDVEPAEVLLERIRVERRRRWEESGARGKYVEPEPVDASGLPELPRGWCWASAESLADASKYSLAIGPFGSNLVRADYAVTGVPVVFVRHIRTKQFTENQVFVSAAKAEELLAHRVSPGDVLITKMGDPPGDTCVFPADAPVSIITADCIKMKPFTGAIDPYFVSWALLSPVPKRLIGAATKGVAHQKISLEVFRKIPIPVAPLLEQATVVARLDEIFASIENILRQTDEELYLLNQSILAKAFRGELVPQDANDEPASVLLERVRAEKAEQAHPRKQRK